MFRPLTALLDTTLTTLLNETSDSPTTNTNDRGVDPLVLVLPAIFLIGLLGIAVIVVWKNRRIIRRCSGGEGCKMPIFLLYRKKPRLVFYFSI